MIGLDTNIVVRLLTNDDPEQVARARASIVAERAFVADTVVMEAVWVLRKVYKIAMAEIDRAFRMMTETEEIELESPARVRRAFDAVASGLGFEDAFHVAGCRAPRFATFDEDLIRRAPRAFKEPFVFMPPSLKAAVP